MIIKYQLATKGIRYVWTLVFDSDSNVNPNKCFGQWAWISGRSQYMPMSIQQVAAEFKNCRVIAVTKEYPDAFGPLSNETTLMNGGRIFRGVPPRVLTSRKQ